MFGLNQALVEAMNTGQPYAGAMIDRDFILEVARGLGPLLNRPPGADEAGRGSPANTLRDVRDHMNRKGLSYDSLTATVKRKWTNLLKYLRHDVEGMTHIHRFIQEREAHWAEMKDAQGRRRR